jgi:hypothetical protein
MKNYADDVVRKMDEATESATTIVRRAVEKLEGRVTRLEELVERAGRNLDEGQTKLGLALKEVEEGVEGAEVGVRGAQEAVARQAKRLEELEGKLALATKKRDYLSVVHSEMNNNPERAVKLLESDQRIGAAFPSLLEWQQVMRKNMPIKNQIFESVSRNINNNRKFIHEYVTEVYPYLDETGGIGAYAKNWVANPTNARRLLELQVSKKFRGPLAALLRGEKGARESLEGLTRLQLAKKLKIVGVAGAGLVGAVAFMSWFDKEGEEIEEQTTDAVSKINSFRSSGLGAVIVQETKKALETINKAKRTTEVDLGNKPEKAAPMYIRTLIEQKAILDKNLARWEIVVKSADDPDTAREVGDALGVYSKTLEKQLGDVGKLTESTRRPGRTVEPGIAGDIRRAPLSRDRIKSVQNYLSAKFPTVGPTGNLDRPTVRALKILEREYDRLGRTDRFSSGRLLVRPNERHLIELGDLKQLDERMKRYKP